MSKPVCAQKQYGYRAAHVARATKTAMLALLVLGVGACSSVTLDNSLQCPEVSIIADGANFVQFAPGSGRGANNIVHEESFDGFKGTCEHNIDDEIMVVEITPQITSMKGPANSDNTARFEYFVALTDSKGQLINKQRFPVSLIFDDDSEGMAWQDETPITLTLPLKDGESPTKWLIFMGLQLSRADLEFIRGRQK
ncbi:MAG: hypothetical protein KAI27_07165 [Rhodospirillaceae bacterium]|nr:hypothetical protein [Rhodospirillaceae bacterium]